MRSSCPASDERQQLPSSNDAHPQASRALAGLGHSGAHPAARHTGIGTMGNKGHRASHAHRMRHAAIALPLTATATAPAREQRAAGTTISKAAG